ncbi:MAG: hypothetical protein DWQ09_15115 [Proteobacteria bacterium]|nr:MAG: hypothetical protein DWQ09_15115 [Pseudomonadota bacterium]
MEVAMNIKQFTTAIAMSLFACSTMAQIAIPPSKIGPNTINPNLKRDLQKEAMPKKQKRAIEQAAKPRNRVQRGSLSVYSVPFDTWCTETSEQTQGRVTLVYDWPGERNTTTLDVILRVRTPAGRTLDQRTRIYGGRTGLELISETLDFNHNDVCPSGCVQARLVPITAADSNRVDQRWMRACQAR